MLIEPWWLLLVMLLMLLLTMAPGDSANRDNNNNNNNNNNNKRGRLKSSLKGARWWTLAHIGRERTNDLHTSVTQLFNNPRLLPLTKRQRKLVTRNPGSLVAVAKGARLATDECQFQFRARRWNCPLFWDGYGTSVFGKILQRGSRETAFIYAITSAGVSHSIARACSEGSLHTCTCDYEHRQRSTGGKNWEWSGCSDNVRFGNKFSRRFVDVVEKGRDFRYMMNLHNNEVGRVHVKKGLSKECKCHGMSGSCSLKTCWMRLASFRHLGHTLKDRFDGATRVLPGNEGNMRDKKRRSFVFHPVNPRHKRPGRRDLIYYEQSPSFCHSDSDIGYQGTQGRECNVSSIGVDGCDLMCCGRGFESETYVARERCSCTFEWCCHVRCKVCTTIKTRHKCH